MPEKLPVKIANSLPKCISLKRWNYSSFERMSAVSSCFPASPAFQYEEASLSHRTWYAKNCSLARQMSVHRSLHEVEMTLFYTSRKENRGSLNWTYRSRCPLDQQVKRTLLTVTGSSTFWKQCNGNVYSSDNPNNRTNRRNSGCRGSPVTWSILKSWFISAVCQSFSLCLFVQTVYT